MICERKFTAHNIYGCYDGRVSYDEYKMSLLLIPENRRPRFALHKHILPKCQNDGAKFVRHGLQNTYILQVIKPLQQQILAFIL
jgi:hypothetical protein